MREFDPEARIETERLLLRPLKVEDTHSIFININHDKSVLTYFLDRYKESESEMNLERLISYYKDSKKYCFAMERKDNNEVIGMIFQCSAPDLYFKSSEVGFAIGRRHWNKGYMTEAFKAMIDFLFSIGVHKVVAAHLEGNEASKRVMEKCGMVYEGKRVDDVYYHGRFHDTHYFYLINPKDLPNMPPR